MILGIDFDNTVVCYDQLFHRMAVQRGWLQTDVSVTKEAIRDSLRSQGREADWTELQAWVYGPAMQTATPFPGVLDFFQECRLAGVTVFIVSHKTRRPFAGPPADLHAAAHDWLEQWKVPVARESVFFEPTKEEKLDRIRLLGCTAFIDDLPEFLSAATFPPNVSRILFDPHSRHQAETRFERISSWAEALKLLPVRAAR